MGTRAITHSAASSGARRNSRGGRGALRAVIGALWAALLIAAWAGPAPVRATEATPEGGENGLELVMVEEAGCIWCVRWNAEVGPVYPRTPEGRMAPLRRVELRGAELSKIETARPVSFTPTFLLVREGREVARIEGYPGEDFFWGLLGLILAEHARPVGTDADRDGAEQDGG